MKMGVLSTLIGSGILCLMVAGVSEASVPRAFVSINGNDANPCSAVQPCRSFNQALTVVEAGGEIVVQDSGGYSTGFTITHGVTIDAAGFNASVISIGPGDLCTINAGASDRVVLRGISFHGANVGNTAINATQVGSLYVEHCSIAEFTGGDADAGVKMGNGGNLWVTNTDVRKCGSGLLAVASGAAPANLVAQDSRFSECQVAGVFIAASGTAAATGWMSNCIASMSGKGFIVQTSSLGAADLTLTNCLAIGNTEGARIINTSIGNATLRLTCCVVTQNLIHGFLIQSLGVGTAQVLGTNPGTNLISGNPQDNSTTGSVTLQ